MQGGNPDVTTVFNDEMQQALLAQADSLTAATLEDDPSSEVRIGERVFSGLLWTASTEFLTHKSDIGKHRRGRLQQRKRYHVSFPVQRPR